LHFCDVTLSAQKPISEAYLKTLKTIGGHLRKKRLDLKLFQKDVAKLFGVTTSSVTNREKNRDIPALRFLPKIIAFLGYDPFPETASTLGQKIKQYRRKKGLSIKKLAREMGIDPTTLSRWERGRSNPNGEMKTRLQKILDHETLCC